MCGNSWNRTNDTSIFSAVLYQLSYVANFSADRLSGLGAQKYAKNAMVQEIRQKNLQFVC